MSVGMPVPGGALEEAVLNCVWVGDPVTVREIHERVGEPRGLVYTTVARVLDRLHAKGLVTREMLGRVHVYRAVRRDEVERALLRERIARLLAGNPLPAMAALVEAVEELDAALLDDLARQVDARRTERRDGT